MKYGIIAGIASERNVVSLGDFFQSMAIEHIYKTMGISDEDIVMLSPEQISTYEGESVILPISHCWQTIDTAKVVNGCTKPLYDRTCSSSIIPVFLGVNFISCYTQADNDKLFRDSATRSLMLKYAPVGCRDVYTQKFLEKHDIPSYLYGCISNALPYRGIKGNKVLLVDVPKALIEYMPKEIIRDAEVMSNWADYSGLSISEQYAETKRQYERYANNFRLVITTKYHAAIPLYAAGIPAILLRHGMGFYYNSGNDIRLSTLNPLVNFYMPDEYDKINWNPGYEPYEHIKKALIDLAVERIRHAAVLAETKETISKFYEPRVDQYSKISEDRTGICGLLKSFITKYHPYPKSGDYYFWGATENLRWHHENPMKSVISELNPNLNCKGYIDTFKSGTMHGMPIYKPDVLEGNKDIFVVVTTVKAADAARAKILDLGMGLENLFIARISYISNTDIN